MKKNKNIEVDLEYCFNRLQHLLYIYYFPKSVEAGFGMNETMERLAGELPEMAKEYKFLIFDKNKFTQSFKKLKICLNT